MMCSCLLLYGILAMLVSEQCLIEYVVLLTAYVAAGSAINPSGNERTCVDTRPPTTRELYVVY